MLLGKRGIIHAGLSLLVFIVDLLVWGGDGQTSTGTVAPTPLVLLFAAACYGCLLFRSRPLLGYGAMLLLSLGALVLPSAQNLAGFLFALFLVARKETPAISWWALAGACVPITINTITGLTFHVAPAMEFVILNLALWCVLVLVVWLAGRALGRTAARLRAERLRTEVAGQEAVATERLRISRDLHDSVAHSLTGILLQVAGVRALNQDPARPVAPEELERVLADIQATAEQSMRELHRMLGMLRQRAASAHDAHTGTLSEITDLVHSARVAGLGVELHVSGHARPVDPSVEHAGYRLVQEGLSNAMKHAGHSSRAEVAVCWTAEQLTISVRSHTGVLPAATPVSGGFGLLGLRERVSVCGGTFTSGPTPDGFLLQTELPIFPPGTPNHEVNTP